MGVQIEYSTQIMKMHTIKSVSNNEKIIPPLIEKVNNRICNNFQTRKQLKLKSAGN